MKKEHILNVEQARHLQELGVDMSDADVWFIRSSPANKWQQTHRTAKHVKAFHNPEARDLLCPTYTLHDLLDKLNEFSDDLRLEFSQSSISFVYRISEKTIRKYRFVPIYGMLNAAYHLLCWAVGQKNVEEE